MSPGVQPGRGGLTRQRRSLRRAGVARPAKNVSMTTFIPSAVAAAIVCFAGPLALAQHEPADPARFPEAPADDWRAQESKLLAHPVQLTSRDQFEKAGEAYFSPDGRWIIFQAIAVPEAGKEPESFYSMYVGELVRDSSLRIAGLAHITRVSPPGSANTCGWFDPTDRNRVMFGSTLVRPADEKTSGFQVGTRRYVWQFPSEMEIISREVFRDAPSVNRSLSERAVLDSPGEPVKLVSRPNYDAECSYSANGRYILYSHVEDRPKDLAADAPYHADANIYIRDTLSGKDIPIVTAPGYDGGPFFSPDGRQICYRSDRKGNDLLQLYVADLSFDSSGVPSGIAREYQLTANGAVNWAPYWHRSGKFLVYASSEISHQNYEVYAVEVDQAKLAAAAGKTPEGKTADATDARRARITFAPGADVLPSFSRDTRYFMWTCQRGPLAAGETKPSSQIWIAEWVGEPNFTQVPAAAKP